MDTSSTARHCEHASWNADSYGATLSKHRLRHSPAGVPETAAVQEILHWQATTVRMMYSLIADALKAKGAR